MEGQVVDTQTPPVEGQGQEPTVTEPSIREELDALNTPAVEPPVVEPPPEAAQPPQLTPEQIIERAAEVSFQKMASWQGRRDKEFLTNISQMIESRVPPAQTPSPAPPSMDPATLLENPDAWLEQAAPKILTKLAQKEQAKVEQYNNEIVRHIGITISNDPIFAGDENEVNKETRKAILDEVTANISKVDRSIPPNIAARMVYNDAISGIYRKTINARVNPLAKNTPMTGPSATLTPPVHTPPKARPVVLDDVAKAFKNAYKLTDEEVAEYLKE